MEGGGEGVEGNRDPYHTAVNWITGAARWAQAGEGGGGGLGTRTTITRGPFEAASARDMAGDN